MIQPHYHIIEKNNSWELSEFVNNAIEDGWIPAGGIFYHNNRYMQAIWRPPLPKEIKITMDNVTNQEAIKKEKLC